MIPENEAHAKVAVEAIDKGTFTITQRAQAVKRNPAPPFITSTLQQTPRASCLGPPAP
ncbi:MAG: hypothetical protein R2857_04560 [Vampirovibrionales bacterium]